MVDDVVRVKKETKAKLDLLRDVNAIGESKKTMNQVIDESVELMLLLRKAFVVKQDTSLDKIKK